VSFLGLLMLDTTFPRLPGDVGHVASWAMPVQAVVVPGASPRRVVREGDAALLAPFIDAARTLVAQGARAITTSCGFLVQWQAELQAALPVPVWTSALLKLPELAQPGVITVDAASLSAAHLQAAGADASTPVQGLAPGGHLQQALLGNGRALDGERAQAEVLAAARALQQRAPQVQALVLECTNLPPFAAALQQATGLPVHHLMTLVHERWSGL
jgi:hypothetical protein